MGVDVRVVATTNRNLNRMVAEGEFRADLYYRLNAVTLRIPPLVEPFTAKYSSAGHPVCFSEELMDQLRAYDWPGNVRERKNIVRRGQHKVIETIHPDALPGKPMAVGADLGAGMFTEELAGSRCEQIARAAAVQTRRRTITPCNFLIAGGLRRAGNAKPRVLPALRAGSLVAFRKAPEVTAGGSRAQRGVDWGIRPQARRSGGASRGRPGRCQRRRRGHGRKLRTVHYRDRESSRANGTPGG